MTKTEENKIITLFQLGITPEDITTIVGISTDELNDLLDNNKAVFKASQASIKESNSKVLEALLKSAIGTQIKETQVEKRYDSEGELMIKSERVIKKDVAPNIQAIKLWLENKSDFSKEIEDAEQKLGIRISVEGKDIVVKDSDNIK